MLLLRLTRKDRNCKSDGQLDVILGHISWHYVGLFALYHALDSLQSLRGVQEDLSQREMVWESVDVFGNYEMHTFIATVNVSDLEDFCIVAKNIGGHLEGRNINDVDIWVFRSKNSADLSVFSLQELVH